MAYRHLLFLALVLFVLSFSFAGSLQAQSNTEEALYSIAFENGRIPDQLETAGAWGVADEDGTSVLHINTDQRAEVHFVDGFDLRDYAYEVRLKVTSGTVGLQSRFVPSIYCHYYFFTLNADEQQIELGADTGRDCGRTVYETSAFEFEPSEWHTVRVEAEAGRLRAFVDGNQVMSANDTYVHQQGTFGLLVEPNSEVAVAEMKVFPIGEPFESDAPATLTNYAESHETAIQELIDYGLVPQDTAFIFYEDYAYLATNGFYGVYLARRAPHRNMVLAGEVTFNIGTTTQPELCGFMTRVQVDATDSYIGEVSLTLVNDGGVYLGNTGEVSEKLAFALWNKAIDLSEPHHLMIIVEGNNATGYVDGQLIFEDMYVKDTTGFNGIEIVGRGVNPSCEARDIWAYEFDAD